MHTAATTTTTKWFKLNCENFFCTQFIRFVSYLLFIFCSHFALNAFLEKKIYSIEWKLNWSCFGPQHPCNGPYAGGLFFIFLMCATKFFRFQTQRLIFEIVTIRNDFQLNAEQNTSDTFGSRYTNKIKQTMLMLNRVLCVLNWIVSRESMVFTLPLLILTQFHSFHVLDWLS